MTLIKGAAALALSALMIAPLSSVNADPGRNEAQGGYGDNCYEHKGKMKCRGGKGQGNQARGGRHAAAGGGQEAGGPPPWAPAHGWRRKHGGGDEHYARADSDYRVVEEKDVRAVVTNGTATVDVGIDHGTCNREAIGTVVGGVIGGVIGNQVGKEGNREAATILGVVVGGVVGNRIGDKMDKADQHCTGQVLEQAPDRKTVHWVDDGGKGEYNITPLRTYKSDGRNCRDYIAEFKGPNGIEREKSSACRTEDGAWKKVVM